MALSNAQWFANPGVTYEIDQSCRYNDDDSPYLTRTFGTPTSNATFGYSFWTKRCTLGASKYIISADSNGNNDQWYFDSNDKLVGQEQGSNRLISSQVFRDVSAWYHILIAYELGNGTNAHKIRVYLNGTEITAWETDTRSSLSSTSAGLNAAVAHDIGANADNGVSQHVNNYDGYFAECNFIDGTVLTPSMFGETNSTTGQWIPKEFTGTYGDNGFLLAFQDSSALGDDTSGEGNDFSSSGLAAADSMTDSPTDNFSTLNPLQRNANLTMSDGNLLATPEGSNNQDTMTSSTMVIPTGSKIYAEFAVTGSNTGMVGIQKENEWGVDYDAMADGSMRILHIATGDVFNADNEISVSNYAPNDDVPVTLMVAVDLANDNMYIGDASTDKWSDGTGTYDEDWSGSPGAISLPANLNWKFVIRLYNATQVVNFGQSSFTGTKPDGYNTLSTAGLDDPTIADPTKYFETVLYTGSGSEKAITSLGFSPDFVWLKNRETTDQHNLIDTVRGATKEINSDNHQVESTVAQGLKSFDSNGFTLGTDLEYNTDTETYVSWNWLESVTAGFDIVGWTGDGESSKTLSHNLGVVPDVMMVKNRDGANSWRNFHSKMASDPQTDHMVLDTNLGVADDGYGASSWNDTMPTSSNFYVGDSGSVNTDTEDYIAYLWANVEGFSKLGSYTGNGNVDGPFVWCGLSPSFVMTKGTAAGNWKMWDNKRIPYNVITTSLAADTTAADNTGTAQYIDFLSNGFKIRGSDTATNGDGTLYIFMAFAESPFKTANAR